MNGIKLNWRIAKFQFRSQFGTMLVIIFIIADNQTTPHRLLQESYKMLPYFLVSTILIIVGATGPVAASSLRSGNLPTATNEFETTKTLAESKIKLSMMTILAKCVTSAPSMFQETNSTSPITTRNATASFTNTSMADPIIPMRAGGGGSRGGGGRSSGRARGGGYRGGSSSDKGNGKGCFAGSETVLLESGGVRAIADVKVGDRVLAANAVGKTLYSEVVFIPHRANRESVMFAHVTTVGGHEVKMTMSHILPSGVCGISSSFPLPLPLPLVYASKVSVGDCINTVSGEEKVLKVEYVRGEGVYTIVTNEEYIVVNGIIASPFGVNHMMVNWYYNVHRIAYVLVPQLLSLSLFQNMNEVRRMYNIILLGGLIYHIISIKRDRDWGESFGASCMFLCILMMTIQHYIVSLLNYM